VIKTPLLLEIRTIESENNLFALGSSCRIGVAQFTIRAHVKDWFYSQVAAMTLVRTFVH